MSNSYIIDNTDGSIQFIIEPGNLDGPGGVERNSDLYLYGQGATKWGEGVNESLFRLAESFACPEKDPTDAGYVAGEPKPKDEDDLGAVGLGLTTPLNGQLWYNTDDKKLYVYDSLVDTWRTSAGISIDTNPASPTLGDLKYDSDYHGVGVPQLTVYTGAAFESVAHEYVELAGDDGVRGAAMTGRLTLSADPVNPLHAVTKQYADNTFVDAAGDTMSGDLDLGANTLTNVADPTTGDHVADRDYNDARYVNVTGDTMSGALSMGSNRVTDVADPAAAQDAVTRNFLATFLNALHPVGSIMTGPDPTAAFTTVGIASTWQLISSGTFLQANTSGDVDTASDGGANSQTLSISNMPAHNHGGGSHRHTYDYTGSHTANDIGIMGTGGAPRGINVNSWGTRNTGYSGTLLTTQGSGAAFENRPQYKNVQMWIRTA